MLILMLYSYNVIIFVYLYCCIERANIENMMDLGFHVEVNKDVLEFLYPSEKKEKLHLDLSTV